MRSKMYMFCEDSRNGMFQLPLLQRGFRLSSQHRCITALSRQILIGLNSVNQILGHFSFPYHWSEFNQCNFVSLVQSIIVSSTNVTWKIEKWYISTNCDVITVNFIVKMEKWIEEKNYAKQVVKWHHCDLFEANKHRNNNIVDEIKKKCDTQNSTYPVLERPFRITHSLIGIYYLIFMWLYTWDRIIWIDSSIENAKMKC